MQPTVRAPIFILALSMMSAGQGVAPQHDGSPLAVLSKSGIAYGGGLDYRITIYNDGLVLYRETDQRGEVREMRFFVDRSAVAALQEQISESRIWTLDGDYLMGPTVATNSTEKFEFTFHDDIIRLSVMLDERRHRVVGGQHLPSAVMELVGEIERIAQASRQPKPE